MGQPSALTSSSATRSPTDLPASRPTSGFLCQSVPGLGHDDLVFAVTNHKLAQPTPPLPMVIGFLPFEDGAIAPRYVLSAKDLIVLRLGIVTRTVKPAEVKLAMDRQKDLYEEEHGTVMPGQQEKCLRGECITELLKATTSEQRQALLLYRPSSGVTFLSVEKLNLLQVVIKRLAGHVPQLHCQPWKPPTTAISTLLEGLEEEGCEIISGRKYDELDVSFKAGGPKTNQLVVNLVGQVSKIKLSPSRSHDGFTGVPLLLSELADYADTLFHWAQPVLAALPMEGRQ